MPSTLRGADIVVRTLERAGHTDIFTLSGNHIMSLFDAAIETKLSLMHVRHEAATVHMADAYGRLTGRPGIAWVTGGPGHANAVGALFTALGQETPMVLLSGHTETDQLGRGGFQELRQVDMAAPVCKAAWMATDTATVGMDVAKAIRLATVRPARAGASQPAVRRAGCDGRRGRSGMANRCRFRRAAGRTGRCGRRCDPRRCWRPRSDRWWSGRRCWQPAQAVICCAGSKPRWAYRPASARGRAAFNDASLGAYANVAERADMVVLLGKALDFTLKFGEAPFAADCRFIAIDPDGALLDRAIRAKGPQLAFGCIADTYPAGEALIRRGTGRIKADPEWLADARACFDDRPAAWSALVSSTPRQAAPGGGVPDRCNPISGVIRTAC